MPNPRPLPSLAPDRDPWDRQAGESVTEFGHFHTWLHTGGPAPADGRSTTRPTIKAWAENIKRPGPDYLYKLSAAKRWRERAAAYDTARRKEVEERLAAQYAQDTAILRRARLKAALLLLAKSTARIGGMQPAELSPAEAIRCAAVALAFARDALGETSAAGVETTVVVGQVPGSEEERRARVRELLAEAARRHTEATEGT